jgi:hypothetical protein
MVRLYRLTILLASAGMLLLLAGCGQNSSGSSASQPGLTGTPGNAQQVKPTKIPLRPSPTPSTTALLAGKVILQVDAVPQNAGDSIAMTLHNQTNQVILFSDHLSECTVVLLQVQPQSAASNGIWQTVALCRLMIVTRLHQLDPGKTLSITLKPPAGLWQAGLYRGLLSYLISGTNQKLQAVSSPSFQIGA